MRGLDVLCYREKSAQGERRIRGVAQTVDGLGVESGAGRSWTDLGTEACKEGFKMGKGWRREGSIAGEERKMPTSKEDYSTCFRTTHSVYDRGDV